MARIKKKHPQQKQRPARDPPGDPPRNPERCKDGGRHHTGQARHAGAPAPGNMLPRRPNMTNTSYTIRPLRGISDRNNRVRRRHASHYSPAIKTERRSPKLDLSRIPRAPTLQLPSRAAPGSTSNLQIRTETPSPVVKIETPIWRPPHSIRIDPPLGFFRGQAADSPLILRTVNVNRGILSSGMGDLRKAIASKARNALNMSSQVQDEQPISSSAHSPLASRPPKEHAESRPLSQVSASKDNQRRTDTPPAPSSPPVAPTKNKEPRPDTQQRLNIVEPVGPPRIVLPADFEKCVLDTSLGAVAVTDTGASAYQVTAYISDPKTGGAPLELYCGTFCSLELANRKVMQVFARDPFRLMGARYADMVFREAGEPPGRGGDAAIAAAAAAAAGESEAGKRIPWTAFGFDAASTTLRMWAEGDHPEAWSFRVEAVEV